MAPTGRRWPARWSGRWREASGRAVYTQEMFKTTHDAANRAAVKAVALADLNLVGLAIRAERKLIDKIVDGLKFHN